MLKKKRTTLGIIKYSRDYYYCRNCKTGIYIFDEKNKIPQGDFSKSAIEKICIMAETEAFDIAEDKLKRLTGLEVSAKEIQIISEKVGNYLYSNVEKEAKEFEENPNLNISEPIVDRSKERIYVTADGSMVNTRKGWKEVKLGSVFSEKDLLQLSKDRNFIYKKEYIATFSDVNTFRPLLLHTTKKYGVESAKEVVFIADGAQWIWNMAEEGFPNSIQILDWYHAKEHIFDCGKKVFPNDCECSNTWSKSLETLLWDEKLDELFQKLEPELYEKQYQKEAISQLQAYLSKNESRIHYKTFREKGLTIGSGSIESAHKFVIQKRLKQSGMRWSNYGGQSIVHLRAIYHSNKWDKCFNFIDMRAALAA
jgi:hypothetical protein